MKKATRNFYVLSCALLSALLFISIIFFSGGWNSQQSYAQSSNDAVNMYVPTPCPLYNDLIPLQNENEEYPVYSAILAHIGYNAKTMVVGDSTISGVIENVTQIEPFTSASLTEGTVNDYLAKVRQNQKLNNHFVVCGKVKLINEDEIKQFVKTSDNWSEFKQRFPEAWGIIIFSRVGFNKERTQALVGIKTICGDNCGGSVFWFLQKRDNKWYTERQILIPFS